MTTTGQSEGRDLVEVAVVLVANSNNPTILNPDFLALNGIVESPSDVHQPIIVTPAFAQVIYRGGLKVTADPERIIFSQSGAALNEDEVQVPAMALRYVRCVPHVRYHAIGLNFTVHRSIEAAEPSSVVEQIGQHGGRRAFHGTEPEMQLKTIYALEAYRLTADISDLAGPPRKTRFHANFHRALAIDPPSAERVSHIRSIVSSWPSDLRDLHDLMTLYSLDVK